MSNKYRMANPNIIYRAVTEDDLTSINHVIEQAVMSWPLAERLKRLSLNVLLYDATDLQHYSGIVAIANDDIIAITMWDEDHTHSLLHGLYVQPAHQALGIGRQLIERVAEAVRQVGGDHLYIKAERVSCSYFEQMGLTRVESTDEAQYPYLYRMDLS